MRALVSRLPSLSQLFEFLVHSSVYQRYCLLLFVLFNWWPFTRRQVLSVPLAKSLSEESALRAQLVITKVTRVSVAVVVALTLLIKVNTRVVPEIQSACNALKLLLIGGGQTLPHLPAALTAPRVFTNLALRAYLALRVSQEIRRLRP